MFQIDKSVLGTDGKILFNIYEQLQEIISLLKPQEVKEEIKEPVKTEKFKCNCGKTFDNERQLRGHQIKCKSKG